MKYSEMDKQALEAEKQKCVERLSKYSKDDISLDLSRGKPSKEQLELSMKMLDVLDHHSLLDSETAASPTPRAVWTAATTAGLTESLRQSACWRT